MSSESISTISPQAKSVQPIPQPDGKTQAAPRRLKAAIFRLATGKAAAMGITLAAAPVITRLYSPENFGTTAILTTIAAVLAPSATLSYVQAIPLATDRAGRRDLVVLCGVILLAGTVLVTAAVFAGASSLAGVYGIAELETYALVLPLMFFMGGAGKIIDILLNCERRYGVVAIRTLLGATVTVTCSIFAGLFFFPNSTTGLLIGTITGGFVAAIFSGSAALRTVLRTNKPFHLPNLGTAAACYSKFPKYSNWGTTVNAVTLGLPTFLLGAFFPVQVVGFYALATRLVHVPMSLFTGASSQAYYIEAAEAYASTGNARSVTIDLLRILSSLTSFPLVAITFLGPQMFSIAFGVAWRDAGTYAAILAPWLLIVSLTSPITGMYSIANRQGEGFFFQMTLLVGRLSALLAGAWVLDSAVLALSLFSVVGVLVNGWGLFRCLSFAGVGRIGVAKLLARRVAESAALLAPAAIAVFASCCDLTAILFGIAGAAGYSLLLWHANRRHFAEAVRRFRGAT